MCIYIYRVVPHTRLYIKSYVLYIFLYIELFPHSSPRPQASLGILALPRHRHTCMYIYIYISSRTLYIFIYRVVSAQHHWYPLTFSPIYIRSHPIYVYISSRLWIPNAPGPFWSPFSLPDRKEIVRDRERQRETERDRESDREWDIANMIHPRLHLFLKNSPAWRGIFYKKYDPHTYDSHVWHDSSTCVAHDSMRDVSLG